MALMAQLQSSVVLGSLLPSFTPQMLTNVHGMLVPISRAWPVYLSWASTDKFIQFVDTQMCNISASQSACALDP